MYCKQNVPSHQNVSHCNKHKGGNLESGYFDQILRFIPFECKAKSYEVQDIWTLDIEVSDLESDDELAWHYSN